MSIPRALVWGRKGRDEQLDTLLRKIAEDLNGLPDTLRANILGAVRRAVDEWKPFTMTWYSMPEEEDE